MNAQADQSIRVTPGQPRAVQPGDSEGHRGDSSSLVRTGFVMEQTLGHAIHFRNLQDSGALLRAHGPHVVAHPLLRVARPGVIYGRKVNDQPNLTSILEVMAQA